jgi:hypothetical protein
MMGVFGVDGTVWEEWLKSESQTLGANRKMRPTRYTAIMLVDAVFARSSGASSCKNPTKYRIEHDTVPSETDCTIEQTFADGLQ